MAISLGLGLCSGPTHTCPSSGRILRGSRTFSPRYLGECLLPGNPKAMLRCCELGLLHTEPGKLESILGVKETGMAQSSHIMGRRRATGRARQSQCIPKKGRCLNHHPHLLLRVPSGTGLCCGSRGVAGAAAHAKSPNEARLPEIWGHFSKPNSYTWKLTAFYNLVPQC